MNGILVWWGKNYTVSPTLSALFAFTYIWRNLYFYIAGTMYYHPDPCGVQILLSSGYSWMTTLHTWRASGVLLKSNMPSIAVYADIIGLRLYCLNKFNVNVHCLIRQKNKCIGKFGSVLQILAIKWFYKFVLLFMLRFLYAPLEELAGSIIPGYYCISIGLWMTHYPTNLFLALIPSPWVSHNMLCIPVGCPFPFCSWGDLKKLHWHHMFWTSN